MKKKVSKPRAVKKRSYDAALVNDDSVSVAEMVEGKRGKPSKKAAAKAEKKLSALDAAPVARPCTTRPAMSPSIDDAWWKISMATRSIPSAAIMSGRRPTWSDSEPITRIAIV